MLSIERLSAHYGAARALDDVSLHVAEGELACIVGPNGAGQEHARQCDRRIDPATSGSVKVAGAEMTCLPPHRLIEHGIAIVPEGRRLFVDMSVRENLELGSLLPPARVRRQKSLDEVCRSSPSSSPARPARRHALGRPAADGRDRAGADGAAEAAAARRTVAGPRADRRRRDVPHDPPHQ